MMRKAYMLELLVVAESASDSTVDNDKVIANMLEGMALSGEDGARVQS